MTGYSISYSRFTAVEPDHFMELLNKQYPGDIVIRPHSTTRHISVTGILGKTSNLLYNVSLTSGGYLLEPATPEDYLLFTLPYFGGISVKTSSASHDLSGTDAYVTPGGRVRAYDFPTLRKQVNICLNMDMFRTRLETLFEASPHQPLIFDPILPIPSGNGASIAWLAQMLEQSKGHVLSSMLASESLGNLVSDTLLEFWPHNYSHIFQRKVPNLAPRQVRAAISYIHDHAHEAPSVEAIAGVSGVSLRALQNNFHETTGKTISEYSRYIRLRNARDDIQKRPDEPVGDIAKRWGFTNVSRFSRQFHDTFGERPTHLRKRI